jgi:hypothetical protein
VQSFWCGTKSYRANRAAAGAGPVAKFGETALQTQKVGGAKSASRWSQPGASAALAAVISILNKVAVRLLLVDERAVR